MFGVPLATMGPSIAIFDSVALCLAAFAALLCLQPPVPVKRPAVCSHQTSLALATDAEAWEFKASRNTAKLVRPHGR